VQRRQGCAEVHVCDHGPGVPINQRERIFEPFYRLPGASEREGGVGLGLSLVKSIAERHRGLVRCESRPGGGARFVVELPL
jgi:signal transduction histidine kinase